MTQTARLLAELEREGPRTRRVLENVPTGHDDWKPHVRSMPLGRLAGLVASMFSWVALVLDQDELDLTPPPGQGTYRPPATDQLVATMDHLLAQARDSLSKRDDAYLDGTTWRLKAGGQVVMEAARGIVLRDTINHLAHHRGQLTVYLRLLDRPVPSVYGPTADDQRFL